MVDSRWQCGDGESVSTAYETSSYGLAVQVDDSISFRMGLLDDGSLRISSYKLSIEAPLTSVSPWQISERIKPITSSPLITPALYGMITLNGDLLP